MKLSFLKEKGNKYIIMAMLGLLVLVIAIPVTEDKEPGNAMSESIEESDLEARLCRVLGAMEGVGDVEVMITMAEKSTSLWDTSADDGRVLGVVVVAQGAGNAVIETRISNAIQALFSIEAHKISIIKMRS